MEETHQEMTCSLCGGVGNSVLMANCSRCLTRLHLYCFPLLTFKAPDKWRCHECEQTEDVAPENQVKRNASASIQRDNVNQGCNTDLHKDSRKCSNGNRQKPVKTGKVRFIPTEEAIRLTSGTQKNDLSFKRNTEYNYNHPSPTRKSPPPIVRQNTGPRVVSSGVLERPGHNSLLISSMSSKQVGRAARELKPAPALELCIKKQQILSVNHAGETKIGRSSAPEKAINPINILPYLEPPPMMDNCNKKQQTVSDDPIGEVESHKDLPAETVDHRNLVSKLGKPIITEHHSEEQKVVSVSLELQTMMDHYNKKQKIASDDLVGEVESHKYLSKETVDHRNVVSKLGQPSKTEHCGEEQQIASVSLELPPTMDHCNMKQKIASNNPVGEVESHKDLPEETVKCRNVVSKLGPPSITEHCGEEQQVALVHRANDVETPKTSVATDEVTDPMDIHHPKLGLHLKYIPSLGTTWKGNIECSDMTPIPKIYRDFQAQPSCRTHRKVYQFSQVLPPVLQVNLLPLDYVLEDLFQSDHPDFQDIGLYFFPDSDLARSKENYYSLFKLMESQSSVSRTCVGGVELLIFTSKQLDSCSQDAIGRSNAGHFLWGLFHPAKYHSSSMVPKEFTASVSEYQDNANEDPCGVIDMEIDEMGRDDIEKVDVAVEKESSRSVSEVLEGEYVDNDRLGVSESSISKASECLDSELNQLMLQSIKTQQNIACCLSEAHERIKRNGLSFLPSESSNVMSNDDNCDPDVPPGFEEMFKA